MAYFDLLSEFRKLAGLPEIEEAKLGIAGHGWAPEPPEDLSKDAASLSNTARRATDKAHKSRGPEDHKAAQDAHIKAADAHKLAAKAAVSRGSHEFAKYHATAMHHHFAHAEHHRQTAQGT